MGALRRSGGKEAGGVTKPGEKNAALVDLVG